MSLLARRASRSQARGAAGRLLSVLLGVLVCSDEISEANPGGRGHDQPAGELVPGSS